MIRLCHLVVNAVRFLCFLMGTVWRTKGQREAWERALFSIRIPSLVVAPLHCIGYDMMLCYRGRREGVCGLCICSVVPLRPGGLFPIRGIGCRWSWPGFSNGIFWVFSHQTQREGFFPVYWPIFTQKLVAGLGSPAPKIGMIDKCPPSRSKSWIIWVRYNWYSCHLKWPLQNSDIYFQDIT